MRRERASGVLGGLVSYAALYAGRDWWPSPSSRLVLLCALCVNINGPQKLCLAVVTMSLGNSK